MIVLVDIDGTLADISHRLHHIQRDDKDWDAFFDAMGEDKLIKPVAELVSKLRHVAEIIYVTGRPSSHSEMTSMWLSLYHMPMGRILMRKAGDYRPDHVVKKEIYLAYINPIADGETVIAIEDRSQVVKMWRELGVTCLQPKDGDY